MTTATDGTNHFPARLVYNPTGHALKFELSEWYARQAIIQFLMLLICKLNTFPVILLTAAWIFNIWISRPTPGSQDCAISSGYHACVTRYRSVHLVTNN